MYGVQPTTGFASLGQEAPKPRFAPQAFRLPVVSTISPVVSAATPPPWSIPVEEDEKLPVWAWGLIGAGGALIVGAALFFALRKRKAREAQAEAA